MTDVLKSRDELTAVYRDAMYSELKEILLKAPKSEVSDKFLEMVSGWSDPPTFEEIAATRNQAAFTSESSDFVIRTLSVIIDHLPVLTESDVESIPCVITCPRCGSPEVSVDATARWNVETQAWEMSSTFDNRTCDTCSYEGHSFFNTPLSELTPNQKAFLDGEVEDYEIPPEENL